MGEQLLNKPEPKIYVACLAAYNNGYLHGEWIDANQDAWAIYDEVKKMLSVSPVEDAEEWAIHDYEDFNGVAIQEYTGLSEIAAIAEFLAAHGRLGGAVLEHFCGDMDAAKKALEDNYYGCYRSLAEYCEDITLQTTDIPKPLEHYIDWNAMARDMAWSGDIFSIVTAHDEVHIFSAA